MPALDPRLAREFWNRLIDNATRLLADAQVLLDAGSTGRARSLTVLAQEELGKSLWIYRAFEAAWSSGSLSPLQAPRLESHGRNHTAKYFEAFVYGDDLEAFWGNHTTIAGPADGETWESWSQTHHAAAETASRRANRDKQRGFYVDLEDGQVVSPQDLQPDDLLEEIATAAQVVEMLLIRDHSRMKFDGSTEYDSTHEQQWRLMPLSHPVEYADFMESAAHTARRNKSEADEGKTSSTP